MTTSNTDYRMSHSACPVVYGSKLITNKFMNFVEQMNRYPCYADLKNKFFPPPQNNIDYKDPFQSSQILEA